MSIENTLERIASALETLVGLQKNPAPGIEPKKTKQTPPPAAQATETANTADPAEDMFGSEEAKEVIHTEASILAELKAYAKAASADDAKKLMIKYGAKATGPKVADIKPEMYAKLSAEIAKFTPKGK